MAGKKNLKHSSGAGGHAVASPGPVSCLGLEVSIGKQPNPEASRRVEQEQHVDQLPRHVDAPEQVETEESASEAVGATPGAGHCLEEFAEKLSHTLDTGMSITYQSSTAQDFAYHTESYQV